MGIKEQQIKSMETTVANNLRKTFPLKMNAKIFAKFGQVSIKNGATTLASYQCSSTKKYDKF